MAADNQPTVGHVLKCAATGAFCGVTAAVLSVVAVFSTGCAGTKDDDFIAVLCGVLSIMLLMPLGTFAGAIAGFFLRPRTART
jgi:hypothetical protein